jgi:xanthine dehydrogenase YagR molybdenum-binding subunit
MSAISDVQAVMTKAIETAPDSWIPGGEPDPLIKQSRGLIGSSISRLDGPLKVQGQAKFAAEFPIDGMVYAAVAFSTIAKGRITSINAESAQAAPGVVLVMTHENAPRMKPLPVFQSQPKAAGPDSLSVMQDNQIHWNGQATAVVLAQTQEQADHAKSLIQVTYASEPAMTEFARAKEHHTEVAQFQGQELKVEHGDAEKALAQAPRKVDQIYRTARHSHNPIELHAVTVAWNGNELRVHDASQAVVQTAWTMAEVFGLEEKQVHVTSPYVGGGFGSKTLWHHHILAAAAAKVAGRPVRLVLSREGVYRTVGGRTLTEQRLAIGTSDDGHFEALIHTGVAPKTAYNSMPEPFTLCSRHLYAAPNLKLTQDVTMLDMLANTFMRAPGESVGTFAIESAVDEMAVELGIDPIELRIRNEPDKDPAEGLPFSSRNLVTAWRAGAERFGWSRRNATPGKVRDAEWWVGMGCATATYPYYRMPGGAAALTLTGNGHAHIEVPAHEMGMGTQTTLTIVAAERLGLPMERVSVAYGNSRYPGVFLAGGSSQTASVGAALVAAHRELVTELLKLAGDDSPLAGLKASEVGSRDGGLAALNDNDRFESYTSILARAKREHVSVKGAAAAPVELKHWSMHSFGAVFCEVRVNTVTGELRVSRLLGSYDCGRILNAKTRTESVPWRHHHGTGLGVDGGDSI